MASAYPPACCGQYNAECRYVGCDAAHMDICWERTRRLWRFRKRCLEEGISYGSWDRQLSLDIDAVLAALDMLDECKQYHQ